MIHGCNYQTLLDGRNHPAMVVVNNKIYVGCEVMIMAT